MPVDSIAADGQPQLTGDVTLSEGTGITLTQVGQDIEIAAGPPDAGSPPVAGYLNWFDFSDASQLTLSGNQITGVNDQGSGGNDLTVGAGTPVLGQDVVSERTVALFGAGPDYFSSASVITGDSTASVFVAACVSTLLRIQVLIGPNADGGNQFRVNSTTGFLETDRSDQALIGVMSVGATVAGTPFIGSQILTATQVTQYKNLTSETDVVAPGFGATTLRIGAAPTAAGLGGLSGWVGDVLTYNTTLAGTDITDTIDWLMAKWEIA